MCLYFNWIENCFSKANVTGSNPVRHTKNNKMKTKIILQSKLKSLKGKSILELKIAISKLTGHKTDNIRLHGSRINGGYKPNSDLDVAILDENMLDECCSKHQSFNKFGMTINIVYVDTFEISWLRYSK